MPTASPQRLDLARLADARAVLDVELPLAGFERLAPLLARADGVARAHLEFGRDLGREVVRGQVETEFVLICQRCFGEVRWPVSARLDLVRVASEAEAEALDDGRDPLLAPNREVQAAELVEDELLLALPIVAAHAEGEPCGERNMEPEPMAAPAEEKRAHPFAALAALKKH